MMKNITLLLTLVVMSIGLLGCQKSDQVGVSPTFRKFCTLRHSQKWL